MQALTRVTPTSTRARSGSCAIAGGLLLAAVLLAVSAATAAETARREGGDDALRKAQYLLRQLTAEQEKLKTDNAKLQADVDELKAGNQRLEEQLAKNTGVLANSNRNNAMLVERVKSDGDKYRGLVERYREKLTALRAAQFKVAYLEQAVTERSQWIDVCKTNNDELYRLNNELLERYQQRGFLDTLVGAEPVTGLGRVRLENMAEEYRYKLEDLKLLDFQVSTAAPPPADTSAAKALP